MSEQRSSRVEQIFDLLVQELKERLQAEMARPVAPEAQSPDVASQPDIGPEPRFAGEGVVLNQPAEEGLPPARQEPGEEELPPMYSGPSHAARLMGRLALWVLVVVVLINVPFNRHGTTLATAMPDTASYVIRNGFVVKEEDDVEIYVYQDGKFRWISSLEAFDHYGYTWGDVHIVPDGYLDKFEIGTPLYVLLKCKSSPHIYRLEREQKRWIRDIDTFVAEGHVWEDVEFVSCEYLRNLPDGETIPPGSGPPPQP
jgi:hypothetical protein